MRLACGILLSVLLCLAGCHTFGKKSADGSKHAKGKSSKNDTPPPPPADAHAAAPGVNGFLAGLIIDSGNQRPPATFIQVVEAREPANPGFQPIDVPADNQGYFVIRDLQPGKQYRLIARSRDGNRMLAGSVVATPPDPKVIIRLSENSNIPNIPVPPPGPSDGGNPNSGQPPAPSWPGGSAEAPAGNIPAPGAGRRAADLGPPIGYNPNTPPPASQGQTQVSHPENIARDKDNRLVQNRNPDVPVHINVPGDAPSNTPDRWKSIGRNQLPPGPARVPSCILTGDTLYNFALNDLDGKPWEFRDRRGRLALVDFWASWCVPCKHAIPHLNVLHDKYGHYGLDVIGIAYDEGPDQVQAVKRVQQRLAVTYRLLLGGGSDCPVKTQFQVRNYPTLVLVDETGRIIWRTEGLDSPKLRELEVILDKRLNVQ